MLHQKYSFVERTTALQLFKMRILCGTFNQPMRPYAVYVPLCVKAIISNLILYLKRKVAHSSKSSTNPPVATKPVPVSIDLLIGS